MMKKLVVLMLIMGIASLAHAAFALGQDSFSAGIGDDLTVTIVSSGSSTIPTALWIGLTTNSAGTVNAAVTDVHWLSGIDNDAAGTTAVVTMNAFGIMWNSETWPSPPALGSYVDGTWATFTFEGLKAGTYYAVLQNSAGQTLDFAPATIIPEPATMVLLGLGALALRRKK